MIENPLIENKTKIQSEYLGEEIFNMLDKTFQIPNDFTYRVVEVTEDYVARMDLISRQYYGTEIYSDLLCKLNGISNPFELNEGAKIVIPQLYDMHKFYYNETPEEKDVESTETQAPKAKKKNEKRKPNEAVVGDKRYKIDSQKKVIVY